jgi:UDP-glucose 4-epimerase
MNILVTGGAGFIGSIVVSELLARGHRVTILDSLEKGHREALPKGATFIQGDLGSDRALAQAFAQGPVDGVMHFAAYIEAGESMRVPARYFRNNTANAMRLVEAAIDHGVRKFICSSTAAVYGDPEYLPIDERHPTRPSNAYGMAKLFTDQALDWVARLQGMQCISLRYFNASGAGPDLGEDHRPETHLVPILLEAAQGKRATVSLYGTDYPTPDGTCVRDYIHVLDLAQAHVLALESDLSGPRHVFNLGNGKGFSNREVIAAVERITGRAIPVEEAPRRPGDSAALVASSEKIRRELGWVPRFPDLEDIINSSYRWMTSHPDGYGGGPAGR